MSSDSTGKSVTTAPPEEGTHMAIDLNTRWAADRTFWAADRTLIAWIRTAISLIGFGITIGKAGEALRDAGNHSRQLSQSADRRRGSNSARGARTHRRRDPGPADRETDRKTGVQSR